MPTIHDDEFGEILVRRSRLARSMRVSLTSDGRMRVSIPTMTPLFMAKRMIASSRKELRKLVEAQPRLKLEDGMSIGKSHSLHVRQGSAVSVRRSGQQIIATTDGASLDEPMLQEPVRKAVLAALRKEANHYLPKRLAYIAEQYDFSYSSVRFSHATSRWGSCSSKGTISLNIGLMNLPFELIDYVLIHELAHTKEMNHSDAFWQIVESCDPDYRLHRKELKEHSPSI
ncbi:MAG TPA: SprT family zinc-dependent metalloprotease [Candidatus Saccharibacteria bacterium]|nr:SprT family zinc-dependent metalloprotease [Candidatus Saccharibacteria bacterium]